LLEVSTEDLGEDGSHTVLGKLRHPDHVEMSEETWGHSVSATAWRRTGCYEPGVFDLLENELLGIIETSLIDSLSQKLTRWLRAVPVQLRHVDIVDEEHHLLASWWSKQGLPLGFQVALKGILEVPSARLTREVDTG
jgi:hypothetical protein